MNPRRRTPCQFFISSPRSFFFKVILPLTLLAVFCFTYLYELHVEIAVHNKKWIQEEIYDSVDIVNKESSSRCFEEGRVSEKYNVTRFLYGEKRNEVQAGVEMKFGMDCYDFAGTVQSSKTRMSDTTTTMVPNEDDDEKTIFHTYWRVDLAPFGPRQEWMLKSFLSTQNLYQTKLIIWSNGNLSSNTILHSYVLKYPNNIGLKVVDMEELAKGTELEGEKFKERILELKDEKAWLDGDLIRLLLLWNYGGVWVDMDSLLTRDLEPLLEHEFVTQWDCYDKAYSPFNGALLRFRQHSPYLCEAFHIIAHSPKPPRPGSTDWGSLLYLKLFRTLLSKSIPPFKVLPFCFNDGRSCRLDNRLPDPFEKDRKDMKWTMGMDVKENGGLDRVLGKVFAVHLHNQWEKEFPVGGWVERLLLRRYERSLAIKKKVDT
ncbi:hypothetical protein AGABI1DRAFT_61891 [Agaricus bisporus var. burnettii JB137-S8]|uniref:Glycosyltransferase family 32 protein n=1 Tax=Agaricus bisporus var. burnettii (strain JB137-S8 / ATCC MYA-4627 / FGSC 10392) TaxID=597362 RepID=K5WPN3_AGABU|nr:uncharacterized protein AGABI1DRAFT_61891 [Agaricus bisporus var. burnettii JB137-S8]EKM77311.1 hypothetical protein AGABI1DRAFT_61891 [Agaricus bisporus var. burnettii JB137-S8]